MLEMARKITYFMLSNRSGFGVVRGFVELLLGVLLLWKPLWARHFLFYLPAVVFGALGCVGCFEAMLEHAKRRKIVFGVFGGALAGLAIATCFSSTMRIPVYAVAVWVILDGVGFIRGSFIGEKNFLSRLLMLTAGGLAACFGGILFHFSTRGFWYGCDLMGWFFLSLGVFSLTVSPLVWSSDR